MTVDDGQTAFPISHQCPVNGTCTYFGMTLLDYFAGQALVALRTGDPRQNTKQLVVNCYDLAQQMIFEKRRLEDLKGND